MKRKYLDNALIIDLIICILLAFCSCIYKNRLENYFTVPDLETIDKFSSSLITVSSTLVGILLTIVTVIITFKSAFENQIIQKKSEPENIFDKKISKEEQFYGSNIHNQVMNVFLKATYEMGLVIFSLILIQARLLNITGFTNLIISFLCFILISLAVMRSFYIFHLFLKVQIKK